jgi:ribosomal protein L16/L10AE
MNFFISIFSFIRYKQKENNIISLSLKKTIAASLESIAPSRIKFFPNENLCKKANMEIYCAVQVTRFIIRFSKITLSHIYIHYIISQVSCGKKNENRMKMGKFFEMPHKIYFLLGKYDYYQR